MTINWDEAEAGARERAQQHNLRMRTEEVYAHLIHANERLARKPICHDPPDYFDPTQKLTREDVRRIHDAVLQRGWPLSPFSEDYQSSGVCFGYGVTEFYPVEESMGMRGIVSFARFQIPDNELSLIEALLRSDANRALLAKYKLATDWILPGNAVMPTQMLNPVTPLPDDYRRMNRFGF